MIEQCRYGKDCERQMCMYTHDDEDDVIVNDDDDGSDSDCSDLDVGKLKPVLENVKLAVEKCDTLIEKSRVKCKHRDFEAKDKIGLKKNMKAKHPTKVT